MQSSLPPKRTCGMTHTQPGNLQAAPSSSTRTTLYYSTSGRFTLFLNCLHLNLSLQRLLLQIGCCLISKMPTSGQCRHATSAPPQHLC